MLFRLFSLGRLRRRVWVFLRGVAGPPPRDRSWLRVVKSFSQRVSASLAGGDSEVPAVKAGAGAGVARCAHLVHPYQQRVAVAVHCH